jgi:peptide/nickel transport system substrate-binding protein
VWWHTGSPVNFGRLDDPEIDRLLEAGRAESDPEARKEIYEDLNRQFSDGAYNVWVNWTKWGVASVPGVGGVLGPDVNGAPPFTGLATGHPVSGMWIAQ